MTFNHTDKVDYHLFNPVDMVDYHLFNPRRRAVSELFLSDDGSPEL